MAADPCIRIEQIILRRFGTVPNWGAGGYARLHLKSSRRLGPNEMPGEDELEQDERNQGRPRHCDMDQPEGRRRQAGIEAADIADDPVRGEEGVASATVILASSPGICADASGPFEARQRFFDEAPFARTERADRVEEKGRS